MQCTFDFALSAVCSVRFITKCSTSAYVHHFLSIKCFQSSGACPHGTALPSGVFTAGFIGIRAASIDSSWHAGSDRLPGEVKVQHGQWFSQSVCTAVLGAARWEGSAEVSVQGMLATSTSS